MDNNDRLIRIRYALDIKDTDMIKIFQLADVEVTKEEVRKMLIKSDDHYYDEVNSHFDFDEEEKEENIRVGDILFESFLNGFIIFKRGKQELKPGQVEKPKFTINDFGSANNVMLKKLKVALSLSSEDMLNILQEAGVTVTKGEMSAIFRKEGHKHYKICGDNYARNFLKGLAIRHRR